MKALRGRVAVVTGASRGIGKGIAIGLGRAGATVYVTGRTVAQDGCGLPGTIVETADAISAVGGEGIPLRCDHAVDRDVRALFAQVRAERARLDILVNNAAAFPALGLRMDLPFWDLDAEVWDEMQTVGVRSHYVASSLAAPIMIAQGQGLIVNVSSMGATQYVFTVPYGMTKAAVEKMTADMAAELRQHGVAVVALRPARTRAEAAISAADQHDQNGSVSPEFNGAVVAALATAPDLMRRSGQAVLAADLASTFGIVDDPGQPAVTLGRQTSLGAQR